MERIKRALDKARASSALSEHVRAPERVPSGLAAPEILPDQVQSASVDPRSLERHRIIAGEKKDPISASFDMLRTRVLGEMRSKGFRSLAVTSPTPGCGKTTVAINLALSLAQLSDSMTVLVDFDLRQPKVAKYLGLAPAHDLSDFLEGRVDVAGALVDSGIPGLLMLTNARVYRNAAETLTTPRLKGLVQQLRSNDPQRLVVFDLPPLLPTDDTIAFLPQVDCVILIVADGLTKAPEIEEALRLLKDSNVLGVVLNMSHIRPRAYY